MFKFIFFVDVFVKAFEHTQTHTVKHIPKCVKYFFSKHISFR